MQFVAIADVRKDCRENVKRTAESKYGPGVATYRDFREMLARRDIDAVLIATGDRWHTMASIYAAKAGKDIYCVQARGCDRGFFRNINAVAFCEFVPVFGSSKNIFLTG